MSETFKTLIIAFDEQKLIDSWLEQEQNGVEFPVDFDYAWKIAGYTRKSSAKAKGLKKLVKEEDYSTIGCKSNTGGRSSESIKMTCDGFKQFCIMANTEKGRLSRKYFIEAEKKWRLVEKNHPEVAQEIEKLRLQEQISRNQAIKAKYENQTIALRNYVTKELPKPIADRILGVTEIKSVEYRDRQFLEEDLINDGNTMTQGELCAHLGYVKNGRNQIGRLKKFFTESGIDTDESFWEKNSSVISHRQIRRDKLDEIEELHNRSVRQMLLGE